MPEWVFRLAMILGVKNLECHKNQSLFWLLALPFRED